MIITDEQFKLAYAKLPYVLREFIASDDLYKITLMVGNEHGLHVDTVGALEREVTNMLLGLINPQQFVGELKSVGIPADVIGPIVEELNAKIFMPLREKMQNPDQDTDDDEDEDDDTPRAPQPTANTMPTSVPVSAPTPAPMPPVTPQQFPAPPNPTLTYTQPAPTPTAAPAPIVPAPTYAPPQAPISAPQPSISQFAEPFGRVVAPVVPPAPAAPPMPAVSRPFPQPISSPAPLPSAPSPLPPALTPSGPTGPIPGARTMKQDMQRAEEIQKSAHTSTASRPSAVTANPYTYVPPTVERPPVAIKIQQPDDGVLSGEGSAPTQKPTPAAATATAPRTENKESLYSALKQYGIDPYREPPE